MSKESVHKRGQQSQIKNKEKNVSKPRWADFECKFSSKGPFEGIVLLIVQLGIAFFMHGH